MPAPQTPPLTVDIIIQLPEHQHRIVLIERRYPPYGWALPGGFVDVGERLEQAAVREAREETGLEVTLERLLGCYSAPDRDPRGHTVSAVYLATATGEPQAADDAKNIQLIDPRRQDIALAFDHRLILGDLVRFLEQGGAAPLRF